jgi:FkbM family methyltransferase
MWPVELGRPLSRTTRLIEGQVGAFLAFRADTGVAEALSLYGVWGAEELSIFSQHLTSGMNVIDVGANIGHHSVAMARLVAPSGRILCIEPQREMNRLLHANLTANGINCATVVRCILGKCVGEATLSQTDYEKPGNFGATDVSRTEVKGERVAMTTLDVLVANYFSDLTVHFVKIDVQSYELFVLQGAKNLLLRDRPLIYLEVSPYWMRLRGYDYRNIYSLLAEAGYTWRNIRNDQPDLGAVPEWNGLADIEWNILAFPHGSPSSCTGDHSESG